MPRAVNARIANSPMSAPGEDTYEFLQIAAQTSSIPGKAEFREWLNMLSRFVSVGPQSITVRVVEAEESQALNLQFRNKDAATNVLSFPSDLPEAFGADYLGDIVICASVVAHEARQQNKSLSEHWAHMLVHGVLHLQGYDHQQDEEAEAMEALEIKILAEMGFADPYAAR